MLFRQRNFLFASLEVPIPVMEKSVLFDRKRYGAQKLRWKEKEADEEERT